mmetsp:Transcript_10938/g.26831  ORF Transcript_10938/g.26831 Transcript_10938/m.26831 type:complete len:244 (-) Transcript_10938:71-802(-)
MDDFSGIKGGEMLSIGKIPKHRSSVLSTRSAERSIRGNSDRVDVVPVSDEVLVEPPFSEAPDLNNLVPSSGNDKRLIRVRRKPDAAYPAFMTVLGKFVLEVAKSVPDNDGLIPGSRDNGPVVSREGDGKDILSVTNEAETGGPTVQVPKTEGVVPRTGQGELSVGADGNILNKVAVSLKTAVHGPVLLLIVRVRSLPNNQGLIAGSGNQHGLSILVGGCESGNPAAVPDELADFLHDTIRGRH